MEDEKRSLLTLALREVVRLKHKNKYRRVSKTLKKRVFVEDGA
jgi:hypothetical protein